MEYSLDPGRQDLLTKITKLTKEILTNSSNKVEIFPNTGCYLPKSIMTSIGLLNSQESDWKKHVTNILVQMFGDKLKFISVKGYKGNIALHPKIRRALFNLINDKADSQISLQAFNLAINKACTNRKTSSTKVSIIVDDKKEDDDDKDDDDENEQNFNRSLTNLKDYDDLSRSVSSSPVLSSAVSRTSSPVMVEEKEKNEEFLGDKCQSDQTNNLPPTELDNSLHFDRSQTTLLDTNNSMFPSSTNETTVEVDIPLRNSSHEQSTITLICSKSIVQHQPAVESTITPINSNTQNQLNNTPIVSSSNCSSYPQQHSTTMTTISGTHSDAYVQPTNIPATASSYANPYYQSQSTVISATAPIYPHNEFQRQITSTPSVSSDYANQYSQNQLSTTTVNSYSYPQQQSTVVSTNSPTYLSSHIQNQSTTTTPAASLHSFSQNQSKDTSIGVTRFDSYYQNNQQMSGLNVPTYNHPHFYNQPQQTFAGYYGGPQWYQPQQSFAPNYQHQSYQHQQNFSQIYHNQ
ncbi:uncharacterized protein LOC141534527 isoform X2 [Cotesia typhae]|uniref:uncharacterized protein LOC141534527 isoform X2 n=1 Tax=Cotesia typhae TaxID=2053667 RepID=UPI003D698425